jgi:hypothetical protein
MAYFVLTLLERVAGSRSDAANVFMIHPDVLNTVGKISSNKGDAATARKVDRSLQFSDLLGREQSWLNLAVRALIRRMGEHASGAPLTQLTMQDLPPL